MHPHRMIKQSALFIILCIASTSAQAQTAQTFQNFFLEGSQQRSIYGDVGLIFSNFDFFNTLSVGGQLGIPIGDEFELGITLDFLTVDPDFGDNASGLTDPIVVGRYQIQQGETDISVGAGLSLPLGDEDIGQGDGVNFNMFGALRYLLQSNLAITGVLGIDFIEEFDGDDYDASLRLGGAVVYRSNPDLQLIGELNILSDPDFVLLNFGVDYRVGPSARLRPALGVGLDNGAPDFVLTARLLLE